jgi:hypothetical protein
VMDAGDTGATVIFSFFKAAANDGKTTTVVLRPITVDPDFAVDVASDVEVQLAEVMPEELLPEEVLPGEVLLLAVVLLVEPPLHAAARSATAAMAPSADSRLKMKDISKGPLLYRDQFSQDRRRTAVRMPLARIEEAPSLPRCPG